MFYFLTLSQMRIGSFGTCNRAFSLLFFLLQPFLCSSFALLSVMVNHLGRFSDRAFVRKLHSPASEAGIKQGTAGRSCFRCGVEGFGQDTLCALKKVGFMYTS